MCLKKPDTSEGEKKGRKSNEKSDDLQRGSSTEKLSVEQWSIRNKLLGFIKRRPHVDTLVKKGVYQVSESRLPGQ